MISERPDFEALAAFDAEICVIGGGPVGIVTALALAAAAGGCCCSKAAGGGRSRPRRRCRRRRTSRPRPTMRRRSPWRAGSAAPPISGAGAACRSIRSTSCPALARRAAGLADRARAISPPGSAPPAPRSRPASRSFASRCPGSRPTTPSASRASSAGATGRAPGAARRRPSPPRPTSWWRSGRRRSASSMTTPDGDRRRADRRGRAHLEGRGRGRVAVPHVVLAAGGNESTRLLLAEQRRRPALFGGPDGPLGRFYMGHVNGTDRRHRLREPGACTTGSTSMSTATAPTCGGGWCRARRPRRRSGSPTSPSGRWCPRSPTPRTARGRCRRCSSALSVGPLGAAAGRRADPAEARRPAAVPPRRRI